MQNNNITKTKFRKKNLKKGKKLQKNTTSRTFWKKLKLTLRKQAVESENNEWKNLKKRVKV